MKRIEPLPWRGYRAIDKLVLTSLILAALAVIMLPLLDPVFARRLARLTGERETVAWLVNDYGAWIVGAALLGLVILYAIWMRYRMVSNKNLWFDAGCPNCMERELVRVSREPGDRLYGFLAIPAYRYACRNCTWRGLRIARREHSRERDAELEAALLRFTPDGAAGYASGSANPEDIDLAVRPAPGGSGSLFRDPGDVAYLDDTRTRQVIDDLDAGDDMLVDKPGNHVEDEPVEGMEWLWQHSPDE